MISDNRKHLLNEFLDALGIQCGNYEVLDLALTHSSYTYELNFDSLYNYERLEFLGDAVLKLAVSDYLYKVYPDYSEGRLSKIRSVIVSDAYLAKFAQNLNYGAYMNIGPAEEKQGGRQRPSNLACAFEAVLGAFYLDGRLDAAKSYIEDLIKDEVPLVDANEQFYNPKAILQEYVQGKYKSLPEYVVVDEIGPPHNKTFKVEVKAQDGIFGYGEGNSKKEAQQKAAYDAISELGLLDEEGLKYE